MSLTEGKAIQSLLTRGSATTAADLLSLFSMDQLADDLQCVTPKLWNLLVIFMHSQILTCILAIISLLWLQKANNFQVTIGLFLLASGALKREIAVMAHAGLSLSYPSIFNHLKLMSAAKIKQYMQIVKEWICALV
ncbi:hypothetical protein ARMGADRAFT_925707 [Armillaria gallica]|uniref:Uncharacterized protein n=1 Tax=Armillaria gallica TaxID=47427 RepID=A0A2H3DIF8_ARMGA|nr:hypothetical protein ARMGADRAFT_925707 [Armillaria gallica]